jgi:predicted RNA-binding protein with PIN domain
VLFIDGHNLIGRTPGLSLSREEEGREEVLRRIGAARGSGREAVVVVFDGRGPTPEEGRFGGLRVVFAPVGRTADEEILRRLSAGNPRASAVVTSDNRLARRAKDLGARVESCEAFWERLSARRGSRKPEPRKKPEAAPSPSEVEDWLALFSRKRKPSSHKI